MKKLLPLLLLVVFLGWCGDTSSDLTSSDFENKEKCAKYKTEFIQSVKDEYWIEWYSFDGYNLNDDNTFVFYSPTRDSCMWAYDVYRHNERDGYWNIYYKIRDLLTNEVVHNTHQFYDKWWAVTEMSYYNAYLNMVYDLQGYPPCYCRDSGICYWLWWDNCWTMGSIESWDELKIKQD